MKGCAHLNYRVKISKKKCLLLQGLDLGLRSVDALRQVMEIATGLSYNMELGVFANERGRNLQRGMKRSMTDAERRILWNGRCVSLVGVECKAHEGREYDWVPALYLAV